MTIFNLSAINVIDPTLAECLILGDLDTSRTPGPTDRELFDTVIKSEAAFEYRCAGRRQKGCDLGDYLLFTAVDDYDAGPDLDALQEAINAPLEVLRHAEDPATALATARRGLREAMFAIEALERAFSNLKAVRDTPYGDVVVRRDLKLLPLRLVDAWVKPLAKPMEAAS